MTKEGKLVCSVSTFDREVLLVICCVFEVLYVGISVAVFTHFQSTACISSRVIVSKFPIRAVMYKSGLQ